MPNPTAEVATVQFLLPVNTQVSLRVMDVTGRLVAAPVTTANMQAGEHTVEINVADLANGVYFYNLQTTEVSLTKQLVVKK